jgi:SPP1 gp7 family putative phage head morphogenesis protein
MPNPIKKEIEKALKAYQKRVADILTKQGVKAHIAGDLKAYKKLAPIAIDFDSVQKGAKEFGVEYGTLLKNEGATIIHGKKVKWLADSMEETREKVADIINEGVRTGKPVAHIGGKRLGKGTIAYDLKQLLIRDKDYEYVRIARTEVGNIQAHAADKRYREEGVEEVDWLCGQKPCPICAQYCGKRYKINEAPDLLVHPNCTCDKAPVVTRKVRAKIEKKAKVAPEKKIEQLKKEERATANELWKETKKDGFEHVKIVNDGVHYVTGTKRGFSFKGPSSPFRAHHTHPEWDSPLSAKDYVGFFKHKNYKEMIASSPTRIYMAQKRADTAFPHVAPEILEKEFEGIAHGINKKATYNFYKKTGNNPTKKQALKIWHDALDETNKIFAKKYKFDYISFPR